VNVLENILWQALNGTQTHLAVGTDRIRRFGPGFPAMLAFADPAKPEFEGIAPFCAPGERLFCAEWSGPVPPDWKLDLDASVCVMPWTGGMPEPDGRAVRLDYDDVPAMSQLAALTAPGPFAQRPMRIGEWYGIREGGQLVAMAGERLHAGRLREISGVCTHPEFQGRGYARCLTEQLIASQLQRGLRPFLHVMSTNDRARGLYERMGFAVGREVPLRVVSRVA
jgi:ribosomal protein S18 acetylase RimI-like enzyme